MSTIIQAACYPLQMPPTAKSVLISMADNANDHGVCWPSISTICMRTCFGKTAVIEAIQWLESAGYLVADRANGRHTKYQIIPAGRDLFGAKPVREANQSAKRTGTQAGPDPSASRKKPVRQADTNHQEPSGTSERENARALGDDQLPEGVDQFRWQAFREQVECDGKLSAPRLLIALGQLRTLRAAGVNCNAVLDAAVMRGLRDLADAARRLENEGALVVAGNDPKARGSPPAAPSKTMQAFSALDEVADRVKSHTTSLDHGRAQGRFQKASGSKS